MCVCEPICVQVPTEARRGNGVPWSWRDNCEGRELDAGLLTEYQVLLTSDLSLQSLKYT